MKSDRTLLKFFTFALIVFTLFSCGQSKEQAPKTVAKKNPLVKIQQAQSSKMAVFVEITGTVDANIFTDIKSPADGIVDFLAARENQPVTKDHIVAVINPTDRVAIISRNQLELDQLESKIKTVTQGSEEFQSVSTALEKAKSNLEYARNMYQTIPVICPMNGLVTARWTEQGNQVSAKDKIITISDMNSLVIKAEANEQYFEAIKKGKKIPVVLNAYPNDSLQGIISLVYPQVDPVTRSVKFDVRLVNFSKSLLPGMMANLKIPVSVSENLLVVPEQSVLVSPNNDNFLFVVDADSIAHRRIVKTGRVSGNKLEIIAGLKENEKVVVTGQEMLKDSVKVMIMKKE